MPPGFDSNEATKPSFVDPLLMSNLSSLERDLGVTPGAGRAMPERIGPYLVLRELGRGGMGVVYLARHEALQRVVAVKCLLGDRAPSQRELDRFRTEAVAVARLQHPNIVHLFEIGENGGMPYCVLEFVAGGSLAHLLHAKPPTPVQAAMLGAILARALDVAHRGGITHRDLKPANVLMGYAPDGTSTHAPSRAESGSLAAGAGLAIAGWAALPVVPKLADFGLAKVADADESHTRTGDVLGTPMYMSPEQAGGGQMTGESGTLQRVPVGPSTDIWALGVILYECLVGRTPFRGDSPIDTLIGVLNDEPVAPRQLNPRLPADLETITLKCLEKRPERRYATSALLAEDLEAFLDGRPIQARPVPQLERAYRWARRRPMTAAFFALLGLSVVTVVSVSLGYSYTLAAARDRERDARIEAETLSAKLAVQVAAVARERERAEANFGRARGAVRDMLAVAGQDWLAQVPQLEQVRRELLERGLALQEQFAADPGAGEAVRFEAARAQQQAADLQAALGRAAEAEAAARRASERLDELLASDPRNAEFRRERGRAAFRLGELLSARGAWGEAEAFLRDARERQHTLSNDLPADPLPRRDLGRTLNALATARLAAGDKTAAAKLYAEAEAVQSRLVAGAEAGGHPEAAGFREDYAGTVNDTGRVARLDRRPGEAKVAFARSLGEWRALCQSHPAEPRYRAKRAAIANNLGLLNLEIALSHQGADAADERANTLREAEDAVREALDQWTRLTREFRAVPSYRNELTNAWGTLAAVLAARPDAPAAEAAYRTAVEAQEALLSEFPTVPQYAHVLAGVLDQWANLVMARDMARLPEAAALLERAAAHHREALRRVPESAPFRTFYRNHLRARIQLALRRGEHAAVGPLVAELLDPPPAEGETFAVGARARLQAAQVLSGSAEGTPEARAAEVARLADAALADLGEALSRRFASPESAAGWRRQVETRPEFAPLRGHAGYAELMRRWDAQGAGSRPNAGSG